MARRSPGFAFEQALSRTAAEQGLTGAGAGSVVVAVSGGGDSVALLSGLAAVAARAGGPEIAVAHLNHRLRGAASDRDALFVAALARSLGVPCVVGDAGEEVPRVNVEARAREARSRFLARVARGTGATAICLGHTRDDQAETVLMRLARGAGVAGISAMEARRADGVSRPLLGVSRRACRDYLRARGLPAIEDSSNADPRFLRNRVRHEALPALEEVFGVDVAPRLARLAQELRVEARLAARAIEDVLEGSAGGDELEIEPLLRFGPAAGRVLHAWLVRRGVRASARQIDSAVALVLRRGPSGAAHLGGDVRLVREYGRLRLLRSTAVVATAESAPAATDLRIPGETRFAAWTVAVHGGVGPAGAALAAPRAAAARLALPLVALRLPLRARAWRPGDRIRLGGGTRKLSDVFGEARIPRESRGELLLVVDADDTVLWVPGITAAVRAMGDCTGSVLVLEAWRCGLPV